MSHFEDDDPPIKSHPVSKEYRDNFDRIFNEPDESPQERRAQERPPECSTCGAPGTVSCDEAIHEATGQPVER